MTTWIRVSAAALLAGRSKQTIYRWIELGYLIVKEDPRSGCLFLSADEILQVEATRQTGRPRKP